MIDDAATHKTHVWVWVSTAAVQPYIDYLGMVNFLTEDVIMLLIYVCHI